MLPARLATSGIERDRRGPRRAARARRSSSTATRDHAYLLQIFLKESAGLLRRSGGRAVLLRDHPAQGRPRASAPATSARCSRASSASSSERGELLMLDRIAVGDVPRKHHIQLRGARRRAALRGVLHARRLRRPVHDPLSPAPAAHAAASRRRRTAGRCRSRRRRAAPLAQAPLPDRSDARRRRGPPLDARVAAALQRRRRSLGVAFPTRADPVYFANGDADELFFVHEGGGVAAHAARRPRVRAGRLRLRPARARSTASSPTPARSTGSRSSCAGGLAPARSSGATRSASCAWTRRTATATSGARRSPGRSTRGIRDLVVKRGGAFHGFTLRALAARRRRLGRHGLPVGVPDPRRSSRASVSVHLPPTWHGTFAARGALICSFVPRPLDFHPEAIPCPYPHCVGRLRRDHLLLRRQLHLAQGRRPGQHLAPPGGRPARPAPGRLREAASARRRTDELAVMLDTFQPLHATAAARAIEDAGYHDSFA